MSTMGGIQQIFVPFAATIAAYGLYKIMFLVYSDWTSPLRSLPGPANGSWLLGNWGDIRAKPEASALQEKWFEQFGPTIQAKGYLGDRQLHTADTKAISHILKNMSVYERPETGRYTLSQILGNGVLVVEGEKHKQQRRVMNPAFGAAQVRELTETFVNKSLLLRDMWASEVKKGGNSARVDVLPWLNRMTLDVIGSAGFNYHFNALSGAGETTELNKAFSIITQSTTRVNFFTILNVTVPALRPILGFLPWVKNAKTKNALDTMSRIGYELLRDRQAAIQAEAQTKKTSWNTKDLLSLLLRANTAIDLPANQRMSDEDVVAQVPTFLVAGHETTSTATTWALYALSQAPEFQSKLREELLAMDTDNPTMDELQSLPYLDAVVRETLRLHAPVPLVYRVSVKDDILPLSTPVTDKDGNTQHHIQMRKGQRVLIPILALNRSKEIWGEDAHEFKPNRWIEANFSEAVSSIPGVWGHMLTFLGGPRACIGYRFSIVELKALLFTLIRAFKFELAVPREDIIAMVSIVQRPALLSEKGKGGQLPLKITPTEID